MSVSPSIFRRRFRARPSVSPARQRGAATLVVVMILFFVVTLVAAYASRNLIFEQRTAANQYRSTVSQEAAEAGIEWALTMLNGGRIDGNCQPDTTNAIADNFRQRYLNYDDTGKLQPKIPSTTPAPGTVSYVWSACVFDGTNWSCVCPDRDGALPDPMPAGIAAFGVRFTAVGLTRPGAIRVEVNGCNSNSLECIKAIQPNVNPTACQSTACALLGQFSSLRVRPNSAIVAGGMVGGTRLEVYNTHLSTGGTTIHSGGDITIPPANLTLGTLSGTSPSLSMAKSAPELSSLESFSDTCDRCLFSSVFGLKPATFRDQQAVAVVNCGSGGCLSAAAGTELAKALNAKRGSSDANYVPAPGTPAFMPRGSTVWIKGGLTLSTAADSIGTIDAPVTLIVEGPLTISGPAKIFGVVYAASATINDGDPAVGSIQGALISETTVTASGVAGTHGKVSYNAEVIEKVSRYNGTFVRVSGGWRDFP